VTVQIRYYDLPWCSETSELYCEVDNAGEARLRFRVCWNLLVPSEMAAVEENLVFEESTIGRISADLPCIMGAGLCSPRFYNAGFVLHIIDMLLCCSFVSYR
jgi:hypothetical protein